MPESTVSKLAILEPGLRVYQQYADKFRTQGVPVDVQFSLGFLLGKRTGHHELAKKIARTFKPEKGEWGYEYRYNR